MAMNGDVLGTAIANAIVDPSASREGRAQCEAFWKKIANVIVLHVQDNAEVLPGIPVEGDVTTGTGAIR